MNNLYIQAKVSGINIQLPETFVSYVESLLNKHRHMLILCPQYTTISPPHRILRRLSHRLR